MKTRIEVNIDIEDLVDAINADDAFEIIKKLDIKMADYDFTAMLAKHFISELKKECAAVGEEFCINDICV